MKAQSLRYTIFLTLSILAIWAWSTSSALNIYSLQLTGVLTLLYFASKSFLRPINQKGSDTVTMIILNSICLLLIFSTGGVSSPLFFLLDFLLITIALLFEPSQATTASVLIAFLFFWQNQNTLDTEKIINIVSLLLMTPVAIIFSKNYLANLKNQGRIQVLEEVVKEEETESLLWISKTKPSLAGILNSTTDLVMYFNSKGKDLLLPPAILGKLKSIQDDMITLYTSTVSLEKSIEAESDKVNL